MLDVCVLDSWWNAPIDNKNPDLNQRERGRERKMCVLFVSREIVYAQKIILYDNNKFSTRRKSMRIHTNTKLTLLLWYTIIHCTTKCGLCEMRTRSFMLLVSFVYQPLSAAAAAVRQAHNLASGDCFNSALVWLTFLIFSILWIIHKCPRILSLDADVAAAVFWNNYYYGENKFQ